MSIEAPQNRKRVRYVDIAKGIGIISIMIGHLGFASPTSHDLIGNLVFEYHVPIFFILAGYFLSAKKPFGRFAKEKTARMLAPYIGTCILMAICFLVKMALSGKTPEGFSGPASFILAVIYGSGSGANIVPAGISPIGAIWFLEALLIGLLITRAVMSHKVAAPIVIIVLAAAGFASARLFWLPFNIQAGCIASLYIYIGHLCRTYDLFNKKELNWLLIPFVALCAIGAVVGWYVSIVNANLGPWLVGLPVSFMACFTVIKFSKAVDEHCNPLATLLAFFGKGSLTVLCVHLCFMNCGFWDFINTLPYVWIPNVGSCYNLVLQLIVCAIAIVIVSKCPPLKKVFG